MGQVRYPIMFNGCTGSITISECDAVFNFESKKVRMSFHRYCGPEFLIVEHGEENMIYPDTEKRYEDLWRQFDGWWKAKGNDIYTN